MRLYPGPRPCRLRGPRSTSGHASRVASPLPPLPWPTWPGGSPGPGPPPRVDHGYATPLSWREASAQLLRLRGKGTKKNESERYDVYEHGRNLEGPGYTGTVSQH